jgi:hypothetical protein
MKRIIVVLAAWLISCLAANSFAQGVQSGTIRGVVKDQQDLAVPGATVTVTSPALQGPRSVVTDAQGGFVFRSLPAGDYEVKFELSGFSTITHKTAVALGLTVEENVTMKAATVVESVQVVAETPAVIATPVIGANMKHDEVEALATSRTLQGIATLSPGLNLASPNVGQVVINGSFAFDNVFMVNGVDVNDNLFATPQNLFVEDAIQETQVLTAGISAEYGRFSGGVINAVTKSGGNTFSGSGRINFQNPSWTTETPFETCDPAVTAASCRPTPPHTNDLQNILEGTFGGPIVKDALWFFLSGRYQSVDNPRTLNVTGIQSISNDNNKRGEIKLTGTVKQNHTIQGGYLNDPRTRTNDSGLFGFVITPDSLVTRSNPNWYYYTNYKGVLKTNLLVEAQYSERRFEFQGDGGTSTNILDSPVLALSCACLYNAPYFDATDGEQRNNRQLTGSATSFWTRGGRHETKIGYEFFRSQRTGGNSQSSTSYVFNSDYATDALGNPLLDAGGHVIPVFVPGESTVDYYPAVRGAVMDTDNNSLYLQDHWAVNSHLSTDLGFRYEHVKSVSTGDIVSVDNNRIVPRLGVSYDIRGNGRHVLHVTYGQYSGRYNEAQIGNNSPVGNPSQINFTYRGPAGQGDTFAPGFDLANYPNSTATVIEAPLANVFVSPDLKSALIHEFTTSYGASLAKGKGSAEVAYIYRKADSLIDDFKTLDTGVTHVVVNGVDAGLATNVLYQNTDIAHREYQALVFQSRYQVSGRWTVNGHYTLQLKNDGNYEGEGSNQPGNTSLIGDFPEAFSPARSYPDGRLASFQRNRFAIWSIYNQPMGRAGDVSVSGMWRVESGFSYSLAARNQALTPTQFAILAAAGYPDSPGQGAVGGNHVFFDDRGSETFAGYGVLDTSINYNIPVFRELRPWLKFDVYNLFNNQKLIAWNTTVTQNAAGPKDNLGLATTFNEGATFGKATGNTLTNVSSTGINAFPLPFPSAAVAGGRTLRVALGVRF